MAGDREKESVVLFLLLRDGDGGVEWLSDDVGPWDGDWRGEWKLCGERVVGD